MCIPNSIAIDGPAASGKSTIGEKLAAELGYLYFDTGIMYRAVTLAALQNDLALDDEANVTLLAQQLEIDVQPPTRLDGRSADVLLNGVDVTWEIRSKEVDSSVSQVSAYAGVRQAMTEQQRRVGHRGKVVMVGRDIGTVVLPDAELKVYLDASVEERARRRYREQVQRGDRVVYEEILASLQRRDSIDSTRAVAPLRAADDAVIIKTDNLEIEQVMERIKCLFDR